MAISLHKSKEFLFPRFSFYESLATTMSVEDSTPEVSVKALLEPLLTSLCTLLKLERSCQQDCQQNLEAALLYPNKNKKYNSVRLSQGTTTLEK